MMVELNMSNGVMFPMYHLDANLILLSTQADRVGVLVIYLAYDTI